MVGGRWWIIIGIIIVVNDLLQAGETIVISSAAGQMGHLVGQIAKYFCQTSISLVASLKFVTESLVCEFLATLVKVTKPPGSRLNWSVEFFIGFLFVKLKIFF